MSTSSSQRNFPRRYKAYLAALAACASLAGGAQLLLPASAGAEISDGPRCGGGFWIDQFIDCSPDDEQGGGGDGSGSGGGGDPAPAPDPAPDPECTNPEVYCVESDAPKEEDTSEPSPPVIIDGSPGRPAPDNDARGGNGGGSGGGGIGNPTRPNCSESKAFGCKQNYPCKIGRKTVSVIDRDDCRKRGGTEIPAERKKRAKLCRQLDAVLVSMEKGEELDKKQDEAFPDMLTDEEKRRRSERDQKLKTYSKSWLDNDCGEFVPPSKPGKAPAK
jgi:hypothetical protein